MTNPNTATGRAIGNEPSRVLDRFPRRALWEAFWLAGLTTTSLMVQAAPLTLATVPPGSGGREPAPNVIVSVDNSGSMGSTGIATLKAALNDTFSATNVPDGRIRLAWQSMWDCRGIPNATSPCSGKNVMKRLEGTHRSNFMSWVSTITSSGWTPSHLTFKAAGDYLMAPYSPGNVNSPWASDPGVTELPVLGCRRSYHIFMTDGEWNSDSGWSNIGNNVSKGGNADGTDFTFPLPDPGLVLASGTPASATAYSTTSTQTRATRDSYGNATVSTLSDLAFYYWSRDLQPPIDATHPGIPNLIQPLYKKKTDEVVGTTTLQPFWNPRNNPATWQNMTTYTIGFNDAATLSGTPTWAGDTWGGAGYIGLVNGTSAWGNPLNTGTSYKAHELWHMALNSRGRFVPAPTASSLTTAFKDILDNIIADTSRPLVSISASSSSLRTSSNRYVAEYFGADWSGQVKAYTVSAGTGASGSVPIWYAAGKNDDAPPVAQGLDITGFSVPARVVLSHNGSTGISWEWANLTSAQQTLMKTGVTDTQGENRLNYVRGDRTKEVATSGPFRNRSSRLGDIVNSNIWYVGKPSGEYPGAAYATFNTAHAGRAAMIYVGANDGMLHGFQASDGVEKLAYVPKGVLSKFVSYSNPAYTHQYFVDGQPFTGDADLGGATGWKTVLVGSLGGGGKGYFILDITDPADFTAANATSIVKYDNTDSTDGDIGYIFSPPVVDETRADKSRQIVKMNDGKWAVVLGNGYNSTNERPVLIVHYLDGSTPVKITPTCASSCPGFIGDGNGLSSPRLLDLNGDGKVDVAYAGDLKGNLWKFDLAGATSGTWKVAFTNRPYFVAKSASNVREPITTAPYAMPHPLGGIMLAFGSGRNITDTDPTSIDTDTMWGVWDNSAITVTAGVVTIGAPPYSLDVINTGADTTRPASLVQQTSTVARTDTDGKKFYDVSRNGVAYTASAATKRGWYLDWPVAGLRVLHNPVSFSGEKILVQMTVPKAGSVAAGETCSFSSLPESTYVSVFNMFSGNPSASQVFTPVDTGMPVGDLGIAQINPGDFTRYRSGGRVLACGPSGCTPFLPGAGLGVRSNWREYQ